MNKQKVIQTIEQYKDRYGYYKDDYWNLERTNVCTMALLWFGVFGPQIQEYPEGSEKTILQYYHMTKEDIMWIVRENCNNCDSFDCMIEKVRSK
jgi:hypothetical protein